MCVWKSKSFTLAEGYWRYVVTRLLCDMFVNIFDPDHPLILRWFICILTTFSSNRLKVLEFKFLQRRVWDPRSSGMWRSVDWQLFADVSGQPGPPSNGPSETAWPLKMGPTCCPEKSPNKSLCTQRNILDQRRSQQHIFSFSSLIMWERLNYCGICGNKSYWNKLNLISCSYFIRCVKGGTLIMR